MSPQAKEILKFLKERGWSMRRFGKGGHQLWEKDGRVFTVSIGASWDVQAARRRIVKLETANESTGSLRVFRHSP